MCKNTMIRENDSRTPLLSVKPHRKFLYAAAFIGNLVAFSSGIMVGWSSPVLVKLTNKSKIHENPFGKVISSEEESWISSMFVLGGVCGPIISGFLTNKIGRKKTLLSCAGIPLLLSYLLLAFGKNIFLYYTARFIAGVAFGTVLSVWPNFLSEISEDAIRGMLCSSKSVFLMSGTLYAYVVGPYLSIMWFNISCAVWPALFLLLFVPFVPESPYHLIACGDVSGAIRSLKKFRSSSEENVTAELEMIKCSIEDKMDSTGSLKSKGLIKALIISFTLIGFQVFSGISVVLFNTEFILGATGSNIPPAISAIIVGFVQFLASFLSLLTVDRMGRKLLFLISAIGMLAAEIPLGLYFYLYDNGKDVSGISWLPLLFLIAYLIFYNFGFGGVPWIVIAEIFPTDMKAFASTLTTCCGFFLSFILTKIFPSLVKLIGVGGTFWLFSAFCALAVPFLLFYLFETKGKSFQDIQNILNAQLKY